MKVLFCITFAILAISQATSGTMVHKKDFSGLQDMRKQLENVSADIKAMAKDFEETFEMVTNEGNRKIGASVDNALFLLKLQPAHCTTGIETHLNRIKTSKINSFFHCSNLTNAMIDVGQIVMKTLELTTDVALSINDVLQFSVSCQTWNPVSFMKCWWDKIDNVKNDITKTITEIETYAKTMKQLGQEIKANIATCFTPHKVSVLRAVNQVMNQVHNCVHNNEPLKLNLVI